MLVLSRLGLLLQDGARAAGVGSAYGIPLHQGDKKFVLIFYSSQRLDIAEDLEEYISEKVSEWRIPHEQVRVEDEDCSE